MERKKLAKTFAGVELFRTKQQLDVKVALDEAINDRLDAVMIVGLKDGRHITYWSAGYPKLAAIGALEILKIDLLLERGERIHDERSS